MIHIDPAHLRPTIRQTSGNVAGGAATSAPIAIAAANQGLAGLAIGAVVAILVTAIMVATPRWFRLRELRQPGRDLRELIRQTSVEDAKILWPQLQSSYTTVLQANSGSPGYTDPATATGGDR